MEMTKIMEMNRECSVIGPSGPFFVGERFQPESNQNENDEVHSVDVRHSRRVFEFPVASVERDRSRFSSSSRADYTAGYNNNIAGSNDHLGEGTDWEMQLELDGRDTSE